MTISEQIPNQGSVYPRGCELCIANMIGISAQGVQLTHFVYHRAYHLTGFVPHPRLDVSIFPGSTLDARAHYCCFMGMIRFHILGAGGALPTATHTCAAYVVDLDNSRFLVDPGPGALVRMASNGLIPAGVDDIRNVLISHLHPDHSLDLVALLFALHSPLLASTEPLFIRGPVGLLNLLDAWKNIYGSWLEPRQRPLDIQELSPGQDLDFPCSGTITTFAANHPQDRLSKNCLGFKFTDGQGHTAVYSGDTGPSAALQDAATNTDLLVVECSTPDDLKTRGHMSPSAVGELCALSQPHRVALTHQYPLAASLDLAALVGNYFSGEVVQAHDGTVLTVPDQTGDPA